MPKKKKRYGGAALSVINELFQPSAASAQIIIEEQREQRVALPSPTDKNFKQKIVITLPQRVVPEDQAS